MKPTKSKAQQRAELLQEMEDFLNQGGKVNSINPGISGHESNSNLFSRRVPFDPKVERTPVTEEVNALDSRKQKKKQAPSKKLKPQKKLITDDFGEPIRWVWIDQ